jgi:hypothetical protein
VANEKTYSRAGKITVVWDATPFSLLDVCRQGVGQASNKQKAKPCDNLKTKYLAVSLWHTLNGFLMDFCFVTLPTVERYRMEVQIVCFLCNRCRITTK